MTDCITIEEDHRHVREMLKGLELERANHIATPCAVESKSEVNARVTTGTDHRWQMKTTMTARHSRAVTSPGTKHSLHESATRVGCVL